MVMAAKPFYSCTVGLAQKVKMFVSQAWRGDINSILRGDIKVEGENFPKTSPDTPEHPCPLTIMMIIKKKKTIRSSAIKY